MCGLLECISTSRKQQESHKEISTCACLCIVWLLTNARWTSWIHSGLRFLPFFSLISFCALNSSSNKLDLEDLSQTNFAAPPLLVISALRAIMAWRMRETSAPPTYYDPFISQFAVTRSHGLAPLLCCLTYSWYIFSLSLLVFFLSSSSFPRWLLHFNISSRPFALRVRLLSSSCSYFTNRALLRSSCSA